MSDVIQLTDDKFWDAANVLLSDNSSVQSVIDSLNTYLPMFRDVTPTEQKSIEELCPFESKFNLSLYYIAYSTTYGKCYVKNFPFDFHGTMYIFTLGGSTNNHIHIVCLSSGNGNIGRVFIHGFRKSSNGTIYDDWAEVTSSLSKPILVSTAIDLVSGGYTSTENMFTCPSSGYVTIINNASTNGRVVLRFSNSSNSLQSGGISSGYWTIPVFAGMKVYIYGTVSSAYFYPTGYETTITNS